MYTRILPILLLSYAGTAMAGTATGRITTITVHNDQHAVLFQLDKPIAKTPRCNESQHFSIHLLKPGGMAILQVPLTLGRDTIEDPSIVDPGERERCFGQRDHVRIYGKDYKARLEKAGFIVGIEDFGAELGPEKVSKYRLLKEEKLYVCSKL